MPDFIVFSTHDIKLLLERLSLEFFDLNSLEIILLLAQKSAIKTRSHIYIAMPCHDINWRFVAVFENPLFTIFTFHFHTIDVRLMFDHMRSDVDLSWKLGHP